MQYKTRKIPQYRLPPHRKKFHGYRILGHFLLLEVLIAFALVVLAVLPLIYPHFYIYQQQRAFIQKIDLDLAVNLIYAQLLEKLYRNEISWLEIEQQTDHSINDQILEQAGFTGLFPFVGTYQFEVLKTKKNAQFSLHQVKLTLRFAPKGEKASAGNKKPPLIYTYIIFVAQQLKAIPEVAAT